MNENIITILIELKQELKDLQALMSDIRSERREHLAHGEDRRAELYQAFAKAQGAYRPLVPNREGKGGAYADLTAILQATRKALSDNGLVFYQEIKQAAEGDTRTYLETRICHSSGACIVSTARVVPCKTDRETGNAHEFQKRLHATSLLGIAPSKNDPELYDDNGIDQMDFQTIEECTKPSQPQQSERIEVIDDAQYKLMLQELNGYPEIVKNILKTYAINTLADLPREEYYKAMDKIRNIKHTTDLYLRDKKKKRSIESIE